MKGFFPILAQFQLPGSEIEKATAENLREAGMIGTVLLILKIAIPILIVLGLVAFFVAWLVKGRIVQTIHADQRGALERRGKFLGICGPGFVWMNPLFTRVRKISLKLTEVAIKGEMLRTKPDEGFFVKLFASIFFQVDGGAEALKNISNPGWKDPPELTKAVVAFCYSVEDIRELIMTLAKDHLRSVVAQKTLAQIYAEKDSIATDLQKHLSEALAPYGVRVEKTPITDVVLTDEVIQASNEKLSAERRGDAAIMKADKAGQAAVKAAEMQKKADSLAGEGAGARYEMTAKGIQGALKLFVGDDVEVPLEAAVSIPLETERWRVFGEFAQHSPATVMLPHGAGTSDETISTVMAIKAAEAGHAVNQLGASAEEMEQAFETALAKSRAANNVELTAHLEEMQTKLRHTVGELTDAASEAIEKSTRRIPFAGKRIAKGVRAAASKAHQALDGKAAG